ncbi:rotamase-domain-containing protein [Cylindrobasidium torrendii FP15055 ss-10]|uniref:Peptidyl-prolyl cis-trans isomerase n=1 Tax=Cylindrobasidium torrendii FP15055 ss-10 TaxID=1314674 RepID=A0A0D7BT74_9AGAR|nr:rotamase-domain-containing protein [Cylindrobasidium torrendii FP15055 ss-10]
MSNSKKMPYFFNTETHESTWEPPAGLSKEDVANLPGAEYLKGGAPPPGDQVRASHLLVKHSGSRRPSSWKEANITRSKEEAIEILKGFQAEIAGSPEKFAELATANSDCSSHAKGGDLGFFGRGQMQRPFEEATYGLEPGTMSDVVETDSGVHLILRTA